MLTALLLLLPVSSAAILATGWLYQRLGMQRDAKRYPPPGRLLPVGSLTLHLQIGGEGPPTVVLESGLAGSSLSWSLVFPEVARFATVCSYDRAGFGWSTGPRSPRTLDALVAELRHMLDRSGCPPPYILVGHSFGGLIVRAFAYRYQALTAGLVLVDPVSTAYWADCSPHEQTRLQRGIRLARRGALLAQFGLVRLPLSLLVAGRRWLPKLVAAAASGRATSFLTRLVGEVRKLPALLWPIVRSQWSRPSGLRTIAEYLAHLQESARSAQKSGLASPVPLTVLTASSATPAEIAERNNWLQQSQIAPPGCRHLQLPDSGHWLPIERPDAVVAAIREMVDRVRPSPQKPTRKEL